VSAIAVEGGGATPAGPLLARVGDHDGGSGRVGVRLIRFWGEGDRVAHGTAPLGLGGARDPIFQVVLHCVDVKGPVGALAWLVRRARDLVKVLVQGEVMPDGVLPAGARGLVKRVRLNHPVVNFVQGELAVGTVFDSLLNQLRV